MLPPKTTNVAVTGIAYAGKTSFLTSLLWNFYAHGGTALFPIQTNDGKTDEVSLCKINEHLHKRISQEHIFDYVIQARRLQNGNPVKKTVDWSQCSIDFDRKSWKRRQRVVFTDFPGERIIDIATMSGKTYADWSHKVFDMYRRSSLATCEMCNDFIQKANQSTSPEECLWEYKRLVFQAIDQHSSRLATPSTLLLDPNNNKVQAKSVDVFNKIAIAGLRGGEFVPLEDKKHPLAKEFAKRFEAYKKAVIRPLRAKILQADKLLVLIDLPGLLGLGDDAYNDSHSIMTNLVETLNPGGSFMQRMLQYVPGGWIVSTPPLSHIIFACTKIDRIQPDDLEDGKLDVLMEHLIGTIKKGTLPKAVTASQEGCASFTPKQSDFTKTSLLPKQMPGRFAQGKYQFPSFPLNVPCTMTVAPKHKHLDRIFNLIINPPKKNQ